LVVCDSIKANYISSEVQPFTPGEDDNASFPHELRRQLLNQR